MTGFLPASPPARKHSIFGHACHKLGRLPGRGPKTLSPSDHHSVTTCASAALRGAGLGPCSGTAGGLGAASRGRAASRKPLSPRSPCALTRLQSKRPNRTTKTDPTRRPPAPWGPPITTRRAHYLERTDRTHRRRNAVRCPEPPKFPAGAAPAPPALPHPALPDWLTGCGQVHSGQGARRGRSDRRSP